MQQQERRGADRFFLDIQGYAIIKGSNVALKTHDVSQGGALVEFVTPSPLENGTRLRIHLKLGFVGRAIVCWVKTSDSRTVYGLKFDRFDFYSDLVLSAYFVKYERVLVAASTLH